MSASHLGLVVLLLAPAVGSARVIHVSPSGGAEAPGTAEKPLRSLERALAQAAEGDTIRLAAGNHAPATSALPLQLARAAVTLEGGWDAAFAHRDPWATPSWILAPADVDRPLLEVAAGARRVVVDGVGFDGGPGLRYGGRGLSESGLGRLFPLVRVERAEDVVFRQCVFLNGAAHALRASVRTAFTLDGSLLVNHRVSAFTAWGTEQGARVVITGNTFLGVWAEKPGGARGDAVDLQRHVEARLERNVFDDVQGTCLRVQRGNDAMRVKDNAFGRCALGAARTWPGAGPPVDHALAALERADLTEVSGNRALPASAIVDTGAYSAAALLRHPPDGGRPATPAWAPRFTSPVLPLLGLDARAGARVTAP
ncbi:MAG: hypothetical protein HY904_25445 [Deltaproteobacteria bacterium]|nr:hypothetical protein [Deltaproteobacteria bacterium]